MLAAIRQPCRSPPPRSGGNFLVTPERRADDLDADRVRHRRSGSSSKFAFPRIQEALDKRQQGDRGVDRRRPSAPARRPTSCSRSTAQRLREAREQAEEIVVRARKAAEEHERESLEAAAPAARGAARADPPRHRGGDAPRDPGDPQRGRRPDGARDREGHAQDARRGRSAAARRGGAQRARLLRALGRARER